MSHSTRSLMSANHFSALPYASITRRIGSRIEDFDNDLDRVFEVCVAIVDGVNEALGGFIRATADGEFNALSLKAEELQIANTDDRRKLLDAWTMLDNGGMSRATFDNWCRNLFADDGE